MVNTEVDSLRQFVCNLMIIEINFGVIVYLLPFNKLFVVRYWQLIVIYMIF